MTPPDETAMPGGLPGPVRLALIVENLMGGETTASLHSLISSLDRSRFEPRLYAFRGGDLEESLLSHGLSVTVGCRATPLVNRKEQARVEERQRLDWQRTLGESLQTHRIEAAVVWAAPGIIPVLQRAGLRVAIERLDGPSTWTVNGDKSGFDRVVVESPNQVVELARQADRFGLDSRQIACVPTHETKRASQAELAGHWPGGIEPDMCPMTAWERLLRQCLAAKTSRRACAGAAWPLPGKGPPARRRVLAFLTRYKWTHTDYLMALARHVDLRVAVTQEVHAGAVANGRRWGLDIVVLADQPDPAALEPWLEALVTSFRPDIIHGLYYYHEAEMVLLRQIVDRVMGETARPRIVFECRDPLSTMGRVDVKRVTLEKQALQAADGWVFVSSATQQYYERLHQVDLQRALVVPHGFAERNVARPSPKLSAADGRLHLALVGSAVADPHDSRYYPRIIRALVEQGIVVHSHFHPDSAADPLHAELAAELPDYHVHPKLPQRDGTILSEAMSQYDLMGVFHELGATGRNDARTLAVCMPTKSVCGWLLGGIPVVCFDGYRGLVEWIDASGIGFAVADLHEVGRLADRREDIGQATRRCLESRHLFTHETQAFRLASYYETLLAGPLPQQAP